MILEYQGNAIEQRDIDGYVNLTQMAKPFNKYVSKWLRTEVAKAYIDAVSADVHICPTELLLQIKRNPHLEQATWAHPLIAIAFAQWLSPAFHVWCNMNIKLIIEQQANPVPQPAKEKDNIYIKRIRLAQKWTIPIGFWCVFTEITKLAADVGDVYDADKYDLIDGSVGQCWSRYRSSQEWALDFITVPITFGDVRDYADVEVRAYQYDELGYFKKWLHNDYEVNRLPSYLRRKYGALIQRK